VQEKQGDWADRYGGSLGLKVVELTSDADDDSIQEELEAADIVCSTPEKFGNVSSSLMLCRCMQAVLITPTK
jgi:replicative superfamily II helicase